MEDRQEDHQSIVVEVVGDIAEQPGSTQIYIAPRVVEICAFKKVRHSKSWLFQLAIGTKRKVSEVVEKCPLVMNGWVTCVDTLVENEILVTKKMTKILISMTTFCLAIAGG